MALGALPPHFADQQPLYENLVYGSPTLTDAQVPDFFKDATFGVPPGQAASTVTPRPGVTIVRDSAYGVPHIYGDTRADTMFGAGYAGAADRLFLMDVLRHTGRADLSSFLGGSNAGDGRAAVGLRSLHRGRPAASGRPRCRSSMAMPDGSRPPMRRATSTGSTPTSQRRNADPALKPGEYLLLSKPIEPWTTTDVVAIASLVGGIFGRGGGNELNSALTMQAFVERFGREAGRADLARLPLQERPRGTDDDRQALPLRDAVSAFAKRGLALPDPGTVRDAPTATASAVPQRRRPRARSARRCGASYAGTAHASNWQLRLRRASRRRGHPLAVMGPQVGYFVAADPDGAGPARAGHRRPRRLLPRRQPRTSCSATAATTPGARPPPPPTTSTPSPRCSASDRFHYLPPRQVQARWRSWSRPTRWTPNRDRLDPGRLADADRATAPCTGSSSRAARCGGRDGRVRRASAATYFHEADSSARLRAA